MKHWTLLGCGALGGVLAGLLAKAGHQISLLRTDGGAVRLPLQLQLWDLDDHGYRFEPDFLQPKDADNITLLLVTTKAYQVQPALEPLIGRLPSHTPILLLHNGMGTQEWVQRAFPENPLLLGITSNGALRLGVDEFCHTGPGETWIGPGNDAAQGYAFLADVLAQALPHAGWSSEIHLKQWEKLVINSIINPLTALSGEQNGALLARREEIEALCHELQPLLLRQGLPQSEEVWVEKVLQVARLTAENYSSMQQDLAHQRPTEIDYMCGYLLCQALPLGIPLPLQQQLYHAIKAKEHSHE